VYKDKATELIKKFQTKFKLTSMKIVYNTCSCHRVRHRVRRDCGGFFANAWL